MRCSSNRPIAVVWATATLFITASADAAWLSLDWRDRYELTLDNSASTENLVNFPVMVHLNSNNFDFSRAQPQGQDIRFTDSNGTSPLAYEIEAWDAVDQEAWLWVNVPQIDAGSNSERIYLYSQNPTVSDEQDPEATWNSSYHMVHHLQETSGTHFDSTSYSNDGTWIEPMPDQPGTQDAAGKIAGANRFWGEDDYVLDPNDPPYLENHNRIDVAADPSLHGNKSITVEAWVHQEEPVGWEAHIIRAGGEWMLNYLWGETNNTVRFARLNADWGKNVATSSPVTDDQWHYLVGVTEFDGSDTTMSIYVDGQLSNSKHYANAAIVEDPNQLIRIGARGDLIGRTFFHGRLDEVRYSATGASADWIEAQYLSMNGEFVSFDEVYTVPEPSAFVLLGLGSFILVPYRRHRRTR